MPRLNLGLASFGDGELSVLLELAEAAEGAGVDAVTVVDHVVLGGDLDRYPYGAFPGAASDPWLEPLTVLAAVAARTSTLRLTTGVLIAPLRPAALLAKTVATLDVLSGGRLDLGLGTGWLEKEYEAVGLDFSRRGALLDQTLEVLTTLWQGGPSSYASATLSFADVYCHPRPVQPGGVPIWIGGELHARALRRISAFAAGWLPSPPSRLEDVRAGAERIGAALRAAGRDPGAFRISARVTLREERADMAQFATDVRDLLDAGATDIYVPIGSPLRSPRDAPPVLAELVAAFREAAGRGSR